MKINEKHLAAFATIDSPVDKEGYLQKKGEVNKSYQRRYFILKGNLLFYFEKQYDKEPIGVIVLEECTVEVAEGNSDGNSFELVFPGVGSRHYVLSADSQENMESWMRAITCANYEYTKLLVSELQRQLDELNLEQAASQVNQVTNKGKTISQSVKVAEERQRMQRQNPFNVSDSDNSPQQESQRIRTFDDIHMEYGSYILEKMKEMEKIKAEDGQDE